MKRPLLLLVFLLLCRAPAPAQNLAVRAYRTGDGLAHDNVKGIFQDAKGYLWIATYEGLSRFDGYSFTTYDADDGLGHILINDIVADNAGRLWVGTNGGGVSKLIDEPEKNSSSRRKRFVSFSIAGGGENNYANWVNRILFDAENRLWCTTDDGLYRATSLEVADFRFERVAPGVQPTMTNAALRDTRGRLWFSVHQWDGEHYQDHVLQITNGRITNYETRESDSGALTEFHTIIETEGGRIFAASQNSVYEFVELTEGNERGQWRKLPFVTQDARINVIAAAQNGGLWVGTDKGLVRWQNGRQTLYTTVNGFSHNAFAALLNDREGNLWAGTEGGGLDKLAGESVVSFTVAQGLPTTAVARLMTDARGRIYAQTSCAVVEISEDDKILPLLDASETADCVGNSFFLQHAGGKWWFRTWRGLEFSPEEKLDVRHGTLVTDEDGSPLTQFWFVHEDAAGEVWVGTEKNLFKVEHDKLPRLSRVVGNVSAEFIVHDEKSGTFWLADRNRIWRVSHGRVEVIEKIEGLQILQPRCLFQDSRGRIWIGTRHHGAVVTDTLDAAQPRFRRYTTDDDLASNTVWKITEDDDGRIYFGTGRGVDQLDLTTGKVHHFTSDEGAISAAVTHFLKDWRGLIWAGTLNGITRINPRAVREAHGTPSVFINRVRIAGEELPLAETGTQNLSISDLPPERNNIAIRFVGLTFQGEHALRYEYKLEGSSADWTQAAEQREVAFANLGAGRYRFLVRAVNRQDVASAQPAVFEFTILQPLYLRPWFITLAALLVGWLVFALYRYRVGRLIEIANMRTRIATDLHDDIGANLTRISLLSEVAKQQLGADGKAESSLSSIARISRESVASMSDIVWAINPERDTLLDLTRKMRQHAEEIFAARDITLRFLAPDADVRLNLGASVRRDVLLIFKEATNNAARHSNCTSVRIDFHVEGSHLSLTIADDGDGFNPSIESDGQGLMSMRRRAGSLGGEIEIIPLPREGTSVRLRVPVNRTPCLQR